MRFLIVAPEYNFLESGYYEFPLGMAYVSSSLKSKGYDVEVLNLNHYHEPMHLLLENVLIGKEIDILCTGGLSRHFQLVEAILNTARKINPYLTTIVGGGMISSEPEMMLQALKADIGVIDEGEETIVDLADALTRGRDLQSVQGIAYYEPDGMFTRTPDRPPIEDLDSIPYPDYDGFEIDKFLDRQMPNDTLYLFSHDDPRCLPIIASRSCPFNCTFCYHPLGKKYRKRSLASLFSEIDQLVNKYDVNTLIILDELFADNRERLEEFCERIRNYSLKWAAALRVPSINEDILRLMKDAGCVLIGYGIENVSQKVLDSMKKHITVAQIENALKLTREAEINAHANILFGDPAETVETAIENGRWFVNNLQYQLHLVQIELYPGTQLWQKALEQGLIKDKMKYIRDGFPPLNMSSMSDTEFQQVQQFREDLTEYYTEQMPCSEILEFEQERLSPERGVIYRLLIRCPLCHREVEYRNIHLNMQTLMGDVPVTSCRACKQRLLLPLSHKYKTLQARVDSILAKESSGRLALIRDNGRPGVVHTRMLMALTALSKDNLTCIFGPDLLGIERTIDGVPVKQLRGSLRDLKQQVDALIISSPNNEDAIYDQLARPFQYVGISVYRLYNHHYLQFQSTCGAGILPAS